MRFFDALKRKKTYINAGVKDYTLELKSEDYLNVPLGERYSFINEWVSSQEFEGFAINLKVNLFDEGEFVLDDEEVFDLMSNVAAAFARTFKKQTVPVLTPSEYFMEGLPITPVTIILLTVNHIVDKPFQITIARHHEESDSYEEIALI